MSKRLGKYIAFCDYSGQSLIVLSGTTGVFLLHHTQQLLEHLKELVLVLHFHCLQGL